MEDRCPGVLRLHAAADGHLARIRLPGGHLSAEALAAVGDLAGMGNGLIELTSRASIQVRGLAPGHAEPAARRLDAAGLLPSPEHDRVRNIVASPLAGRPAGALLDSDGVVTAIDGGLCADAGLASLPGRFLFAVEDGSGLLGGGQADVTLAAERAEGAAPRLRLHLDGRPTTLTATAAAAAGLALEAARAFLAVLSTVPARDDASVWRISDLPASALDALLARLETRFTPGPSLGRGRPPALGTVVQADGRHALTALAPLGRLHAGTVRGLAPLAASGGAAVRVSPWRTVSVLDVPAASVADVAATLAELGLVLDETSGWRGLTACAGRGACASARVDVRAAAARRAEVRSGTTARAEHWSACERGCGRPAGAAHLVTATADGVEVRGGDVRQQLLDVEGALGLLGDRDARRGKRPLVLAGEVGA